MSYSFLKRVDKGSLTRISVSGGGGVFHVRIGAGDMVDAACVRWERGNLKCDCGSYRSRACPHIESLEACGFLDDWNEPHSSVAEAA